MDLLGGDVGFQSQRCKYRNGLSRVLLLLRVELRCRQPLCAGVQAVHRLAGHFPALPVVVHRVCLLAVVRPLAEEHCAEQTAALRGEELRLHKRAAYSQYGVRLNGQEKDDAHHGHGAVARGDVQAEGIGDFTAERHEIPVLPVDRFRGRTAALYGAWHGLQPRFGQGLDSVETVKVLTAQKRANATLRIRLRALRYDF